MTLNKRCTQKNIYTVLQQVKIWKQTMIEELWFLQPAP